MLEIAPFDPVDTNDLVRMWRASFEAGVGIVDPHPIEEQTRYFETEVRPRSTVLVARRHGSIVGFCAFDATTVLQLYVRVGFQRAGTGERLLDVAKDASSGRLELHTFARNAGARAFYARQGFAEIAFGFEPHWKLDDVKLEWRRPAS
jgi:ribosomal protein S18 acetylase RimI-like enzyme